MAVLPLMSVYTPGLGVLGFYAVGAYGGMDVVAVVVAGLKHLGVCLEYCGLLGKLLAKVVKGGFERTVEEPAHKAEGEDVSAFEHALVVETRVGQRGLCHRCYGHFHQLGRDAELGEGVEGGILGLFEVGLAEKSRCRR